MIAHRIRMLNDIDTTSDARGLDLPCCYIQGMRDRLIASRCLADFKECLPRLVVKKVDGPHGILQAQPEQCARIIMDFVEELASR